MSSSANGGSTRPSSASPSTRSSCEHFPHLFNVEFTAQMEEELDTIASGKQTYRQVMEDFYHPFIRDLEGVDKKSAAIKKSLQEPTERDVRDRAASR